MLLSFARMSHFVLGFFFGPKIIMMFTFVVTHAYPIKKSHNPVENSNTCTVFIRGFNIRLYIYDLF